MSDSGCLQENDDCLERFEKAWASGQFPDIEAFLPLKDSPEFRIPLLVDLIELDLEYRWRHSNTVRNGDSESPLLWCHASMDYVARFPDLRGDEVALERLLIHEHRVRRRWGDNVDFAELLTQNKDCVSDTLRRKLLQPFVEETDIVADRATERTYEGTVIGSYRILQKIAEGGMGAVYMADQELPIRRRVALKLIKAGTDSSQIIARFEAERQALAMMDHPNIARIFDGGTTAEGLPYFVMELVKGIPLTDYCDRNRLSIRDRLELFVSVCKAVQHAHLKGIIHRDLKPSNVLVALHDGIPIPKVIDFGLAKAVDHQTKLTEKSMFTEFGQVVGTLQYMSPEQAEMNQLDVDTRTDVYSLGVMLYELLTGSTPLERVTLGQKPLLTVLAMIRDLEPPRPSSRLSKSGDAIASVSEQRRIEPAKLKRMLRGELDWIVVKAIEKDRTRRYETANELGLEVRCVLDGKRPWVRPPSTIYCVGKFVRKHLAAVSALVALITILIITTSISTAFYFDALTQKEFAEEAFRKAEDEAAHARQARDETLHEVAGQIQLADELAEIFDAGDPVFGSLFSRYREDTQQPVTVEAVVRKIGEAELSDHSKFRAFPKVRGKLLNSLGNIHLSSGDALVTSQ
ncbi:MAG: serine/threonine-protein kinase [Planctomycetaceae bacterium]